MKRRGRAGHVVTVVVLMCCQLCFLSGSHTSKAYVRDVDIWVDATAVVVTKALVTVTVETLVVVLCKRLSRAFKKAHFSK